MDVIRYNFTYKYNKEIKSKSIVLPYDHKEDEQYTYFRKGTREEVNRKNVVEVEEEQFSLEELL
jgi:hypothetical protein